MLLIFVATFALLVLFVYIRKGALLIGTGLHSYFVIANASLALLTFALLEIVNLSNPGRILPKVPFLTLLEDFDATQLCPECQTLKTIRSRHCSVCHTCVERFDHHCPWINNCVGVKNHNWFILYITAQYLLLLDSLAITLYAIVTFQPIPTEEDQASFLYHGPWQYDKAAFYIAVSVILFFVVLFLIPLS
jgi:hypothetical protein